MGSGGGTVVHRSSVVGSSVVGSRMVGSGGSTMVRRGCVVGSGVVGSGMVRSGMVRGRVGRSLSVMGIHGAGAIVGLARVGNIGDIARVCIIHVVGHSLMGNSTHLGQWSNI